MNGLALLIEYVKVDPVERRSVAGAPHDIGHVNDPSVLHDGRAVPYADRAWQAYDPGGIQIVRPDPTQRDGHVQHLRSQPPPNRVRHADHPRDKEPERWGEQPIDPAPRASRLASRVPAG